MENNRLHVLLTVVQKALLLEPYERLDYIRQACGDDETLEAEVDDMLRSVDYSETFWDEWHQWSGRQFEKILRLPDPANQELAGERIGPWKIIKPLGEGGMGVVYLAERADGSYRHRVALKFLRQNYKFLDLRSRSIKRFQQERQILAKLDHPNIARLYDGGYTADGLPWLAMEYIDGLPITEWCRRRKSPLKERLHLFKKICEAIRYAHKNLVVHRDLKPDNILVTPDGQVKILDFGIAKLLDDEFHVNQDILTQTGQRELSLIYAAPEQINGDPVTTATDVYALGLLLYELIAGVYPYKLDGLNQRQIEKLILTTEPAKPSTVQNEDDSIPGSQNIRGDLDAVTMKALRKEPDHRYENAGHMLDDIIRYQKNLPIIARRDSVRYRMGKFFKRHKRPLVTGLAVMLGAIVLTVYYTWQLAHERNIAKMEAATAEQISGFLTEMFRASDPSEARGENITARELLDRGAARIGELSGQYEVQATMLHLMGHIYWSIGSYDEAVPLLEQAIELRMQHSDDDPELAHSYFTLGMVLHDLGDYRGAVPYFENAVEIYRKNPGHKSPEFAASLENMGYVEDARRNYRVSEALHREALEMRLGLFGPDHPDVGQSHYSIAISLGHLDRPEEAITSHREALRIFRLNEMTDTRVGARILRSLGSALTEKEEFDEAEKVLSEALKINRHIHGEKFLDTGLVIWTLAALNGRRGDFLSAELLYNESIGILREAIGHRHVMVGQALQELGSVFNKTSDHLRAEQAFRESLEIFLANDRVHPQRIVTTRRKLGSTLVKLRRYEEAESLLLGSLSAASEMAAVNGDNEIFVTRSLEELVVLYSEWGRIELSERYREKLAVASRE